MEQRRFGQYRVVRRLGTGGMASVYEAVHEPSGQRSAVKVLHQTFAQNSDVLNRFFNEAKAANLVIHPGVVHIYECGMAPGGVAYLAMEYLDGVSLHERLYQAGGTLPEGTVLQLGEQAASALSVMHERKIVHRDLKPENVMIVPDPTAVGGERVKILDFGIAKLAMGTGQPGAMPTRTGVLMGTPTYMAPEQCRGARGVDDRADVYALGVILYQMVAGAPPFGSPGAAEVMSQHVYEVPQPLAVRAPKVTPGLASLIDQMLLKQPSSRPSMAEVEKRLAVLAGHGPEPIVEDPSATLVYSADALAAAQPIAPSSTPEAKTQVGELGRGPALLPPQAQTQVGDGPPADAKTKMVVALVPATAPTQIQDGQRRGGEERTQLKVPAPNDDPETLRPEEAQQAAEQIRRSAKTKLVSVIPTLMAVPQPLTSPMPQPTLLDGDHQRLSILSQPSRTLHFTLLGALLMSVALLVLYALLG